MNKHESREARLERYANDRRFTQIVAAFADRGMRTLVFAPDGAGVMHRINPSTAQAVCGTAILSETKIEFYRHATCVWCVAAT